MSLELPFTIAHGTTVGRFATSLVTAHYRLRRWLA